MNDSLMLDYTQQALILTLMLSMPPIVVAAASGLLVALLQAVTQVQEQTLSFAVKLVAVMITIMLTARWVGVELYMYASRLFEIFPVVS